MENLKYTEILQLNKELAKDKYNIDFSAKILSNVTVNSIKELFEYSLRLKKINPTVEIGNFDNIVQDSVSSNNHNVVFVFYDILNIVDNISNYFESLDVDSILELEQRIKSEIDLILFNLRFTPTVIFNTFSTASFVSPFVSTTKLEKFVSEINNYLNNQTTKNLVLVNIDKIIFELGRAQAYDFRFYQSSKAPYSIMFFKTYIRAIESTILKVTGKLKKAIIFDCDNTLWNGIIGEDGLDNIQMTSNTSYGKAFYDVQCIAKYLSKNGVLVGLCSKNNLSDVDEVINNHKDMILSNEDIIIKKINWNDKATNLQEIATELNIGIDSLLFIDDSDYEINLVKERLPSLKTFQVPKNKYSYKNELLDFIYQNTNLLVTTEDLKKTEQYKDQIVRETEKANFDSMDSYISSLEIKLDIHKDNVSQIARVSQLTQKTNQFNLTTHRYTETEIEEQMISKTKHVYTALVRDKFGDSGLTIVCIIFINNEKTHASIDSLLMSCRIIGRNIESVFMDQVFEDLKNNGILTIDAIYLKTAKNNQVSNFYDQLGFSIVNEEDQKKEFLLDFAVYEKSNIDYIDINKNY
jgi:FkbH-like protein